MYAPVYILFLISELSPDFTKKQNKKVMKAVVAEQNHVISYNIWWSISKHDQFMK